jgi:hypothetical protein
MCLFMPADCSDSKFTDVYKRIVPTLSKTFRSGESVPTLCSSKSYNLEYTANPFSHIQYHKTLVRWKSVDILYKDLIWT